MVLVPRAVGEAHAQKSSAFVLMDLQPRWRAQDHLGTLDERAMCHRPVVGWASVFTDILLLCWAGHPWRAGVRVVQAVQLLDKALVIQRVQVLL